MLKSKDRWTTLIAQSVVHTLNTGLVESLQSYSDLLSPSLCFCHQSWWVSSSTLCQWCGNPAKGIAPAYQMVPYLTSAARRKRRSSSDGRDIWALLCAQCKWEIYCPSMDDTVAIVGPRIWGSIPYSSFPTWFLHRSRCPSTHIQGAATDRLLKLSRQFSTWS